MARVPISIYLNILAGILVLFNHYVASETGDVALNKVTGAASRFYSLFRDTVLTIQHGCASRLEMALCGPALESFLSHDAVAGLRVRYCHPPPVQDSKDDAETSNDWQPHGGYGGSEFAIVYHHHPVRLLTPSTSAKGFLDVSSQRCLSQAVWNWTSETVEMMGMFVLRTCTSWWWFRAPLAMTGYLLTAYVALSALDYLLGASVVIQYVSQAFVIVVADLLRWIEWESQRLVVDIGVMMMERVYDFLVHIR